MLRDQGAGGAFFKQHCWIALALIGMWAWGGFLYSNTLHGSFQFDDSGYIIHNKSIRDLSNVNAIWNFRPRPTRFVAFYTFALNFHFHQLHVFGYHLVNVIIHLGNATLVWWLVYLWGRRNKPLGREGQALWIGFAAAMIFCVHPVQTQAVSYLSQRFASLATFFYLLSICLYIKGRRSDSFLEWRAWGYFLGGLLSGVLGMFTKQIVLTLPMMIAVMEGYGLVVSKRSQEDGGARFGWPAGVILLSLALIIPMLYAFNVSGILSMQVPSDSHQGDFITPFRYGMTQWRVLCTYLRLWFLPFGQRLDYDFPLSYHLLAPATLAALGALGTLGIGAFKIRRRHALISFGVGWFFIALSVESSIIVIRNVIFEHRMYLASVGLVLVLVVGGQLFFKERRKFFLSMGLVILTLSYMTYQRNVVWIDAFTLWRDAQIKAPMKARPYYNLGDIFYKQGRFDKAMVSLNQAIALDADYYKSYADRGIIHALQGRPDAALQDFNRLLSYRPKDAPTLNNRGKVYSQQQRYVLALADFSEALRIDPDYFTCYRNRGDAYRRQGKLALALKDYSQALRVYPYAPEVYFVRGRVYEELGQGHAAFQDYQRALQLNPAHRQAQGRRSLVLQRLRGEGKDEGAP